MSEKTIELKIRTFELKDFLTTKEYRDLKESEYFAYESIKSGILAFYVQDVKDLYKWQSYTNINIYQNKGNADVLMPEYFILIN